MIARENLVRNRKNVRYKGTNIHHLGSDRIVGQEYAAENQEEESKLRAHISRSIRVLWLKNYKIQDFHRKSARCGNINSTETRSDGRLARKPPPPNPKNLPIAGGFDGSRSREQALKIF